MEEKKLQHELIDECLNAHGEPMDICSCGARWSHPKNRSKEERNSIFLSHVKYFENETLVL